MAISGVQHVISVGDAFLGSSAGICVEIEMFISEDVAEDVYRYADIMLAVADVR